MRDDAGTKHEMVAAYQRTTIFYDTLDLDRKGCYQLHAAESFFRTEQSLR
jgi:hypothetical protein